MKPKAIAHYKKYGGMWYVVHSDRKMFSSTVSDYFPEKHEAEAARDSLSGQYPAEQLFIIQNKTLEEMKVSARESKERRKFHVTYYQVAVSVPYCGTKMENAASGMFASRFRAVRALRSIRRTLPSAYLMEHIRYYREDELSDRREHLRRIIR